ncbi:hypothetical protein, partial [Pseudomonas aeruginosa]
MTTARRLAGFFCQRIAMANPMQRLIQFVLRGRDELSPAAQQSTEALEGLRTTAANLNRQLDDA